MTTDGNAEERRISGFESGAKPLDSVRFPHDPLGQNYPQHYPQARERKSLRTLRNHREDCYFPQPQEKTNCMKGTTTW